MILKILLIIGVIFVVYIMFFKKKPLNQTAKKRDTKQKESSQVNELVECASCGVYCELEEAILSNSKYYCSTECVNKAS